MTTSGAGDGGWWGYDDWDDSAAGMWCCIGSSGALNAYVDCGPPVQ